MPEPVPEYSARQILSVVNNMLVSAGVDTKIPQLYQLVMQNIASPGAPLFNDLFDHLDNVTNRSWRYNGIHEQELRRTLKPWLESALDHTLKYLRQQSGMMQSQQGYGLQNSGFGQAPSTPTYGVGSGNDQTSFQQPVQASIIPSFQNTTVKPDGTSSGYNQGGPVMLNLKRVPTIDIPNTGANSVIHISGYSTGDHEKDRIITTDVTLRMAHNNAQSVGRIVYDESPQDVVRGLFANVIRYHELFHIPIGYHQFLTIAEEIGAAYYKKEKNDWRIAIEAINSRKRAEWNIINEALIRLLFPAIFRRLRTSDGGVIDKIDSIDDLSILDDRNAKIKVAQHPDYWSTFNNLVMSAIERLFDPTTLIKPDDKNFGDFIHCNAVKFYRNGLSKYDYGTFIERVDKDSFVKQLLESNTVIRVPRVVILTNALDAGLVRDIKYNSVSSQGMLSKNLNTVGTSLIQSLDSPKRDTIEAVLCMMKGSHPDDYYEKINLGRTLDQDLVLLR